MIPVMTRHKTTRSRPVTSAGDDRTTRQRLLRAARHVFAEHGYDRATGKEICRRAGVNTAAVNYYFGGVDGLYDAVVREAHDRVVTFDALTAAVADKVDAKARLRAFIESFVRGLTGPASASWVLRVLGREIVSPSPVFDALREKELLPKSRLLRSIVAELTGLSEDHPAVARGCISVIAPCIMLLVLDRRTLRRLAPSIRLTADDTDALVDHLVRFALAGLSAMTADARKEA
jgi:AcrR family transcriptional regulator